MSVTFSLIDPDNTEYPLTFSGTTWKRFLEDIPEGAIGYPPIRYRTLTLPGKDGVIVEEVRLGERTIDLPLSLIAGDVANLLGAIKPLYQGARVRRDLATCKLKVTKDSTSVYLNLRLADEVWKSLSGISRQVGLRFTAADPYWYKDTQSSNLDIASSKSFNKILQRNFSGSALGWNNMAGGVNATPICLLLQADGTLYAGGNFTTVGGVSISRIAKWNGTSWSALGTGANDYVRALVIGPDGALYAGGDFTSIGGVAANYIAKWNGSSWSPLGTGMNARVKALCFAPDGFLYAGGEFTTAGGITTGALAKWNGSAWSSAVSSTPTGGINALVSTSTNALYVVGEYAISGYPNMHYVEKLVDSNWVLLNFDPDGAARAAALGLDGSLYVGGDYSCVYKWDGSVWAEVGYPFNGRVRALATAPDGALYAAGDFTTIGGVPVNDGVAYWNGYRWVSLDFDFSDSTAYNGYSLAVSQDSLVVGLFSQVVGGSASSVSSVSNQGDTTYPILQVTGLTGSVTFEYLENATTQQRVWMSHTIQPGEALTIDFAKSTAVSSLHGNVFNKMIPGSDFDFRLDPGENEILLFAVGSGTAQAQLQWFERYATLAEALG
jgi:hypothetical protein